MKIIVGITGASGTKLGFKLLSLFPKNIEVFAIVSNGAKQALELEESDEWKKDNMEYDLRSTQWIIDKVKNDDVYAQHLYASICNNDFTKNDV